MTTPDIPYVASDRPDITTVVEWRAWLMTSKPKDVVQYFVGDLATSRARSADIKKLQLAVIKASDDDYVTLSQIKWAPSHYTYRAERTNKVIPPCAGPRVPMRITPRHRVWEKLHADGQSMNEIATNYSVSLVAVSKALTRIRKLEGKTP